MGLYREGISVGVHRNFLSIILQKSKMKENPNIIYFKHNQIKIYENAKKRVCIFFNFSRDSTNVLSPSEFI